MRTVMVRKHMLKLGCISRILLGLSLGQKLFKDGKRLITQKLGLIDQKAFCPHLLHYNKFLSKTCFFQKVDIQSLKIDTYLTIT